MLSLRKLLLAGIATVALTTAAPIQSHAKGAVNHVLLISVDGMHQIDLARWISSHPTGALAGLAQRGVTYTHALTTAPSDSFPGMIAQATGGTPFSAGVFYDDSYDRTYYPPSSNCAGTPGAEVTYAENLDYNLDDITGGGTLGKSLTQINPANLPMTYVNGKCDVVWPHQFIRVNTLFEVLRAHGMHTAWSDKHPAYEILNGPSGKGIEDLYTPEINSQMPGAPAGKDNTKSFKGVRDYDSIKVQVILNQIDARHSTGYYQGYTPAIFGMNFQSVSVGQKLAKAGYGDDPSLTGGYADASGKPGNALTLQLQFIDDSVGKMVAALAEHNLFNSTAIIISAKHGQSPIDRTLRQAIPDTYSTVLQNDGYGFNIADDVSLIWLAPSQRSNATLAQTVTDLRANATALGIRSILGRNQLIQSYQDPITDSRTPDFIAVPNHGVIYTSGSKLSEHGGLSMDDRHVGMLVSAPGLTGTTVTTPVTTTQIAPTILWGLGVAPTELQAVQIEHTQVLPGLNTNRP